MDEEYNEYLSEHKNNVIKAFNWLNENLFQHGKFISDKEIIKDAEYNIVYKHDLSKMRSDEWDAYKEYFYGNNKSYRVVREFKYAWLNHIHRNPHHWQYWVLNNDDSDEGEEILDMPDEYIIEMICDWWSFSWKENRLDEIFKFYDKHKDYIKLSRSTRTKVEKLLNLIKEKLNGN